jgi:hypothetical protein
MFVCSIPALMILADVFAIKHTRSGFGWRITYQLSLMGCYWQRYQLRSPFFFHGRVGCGKLMTSTDNRFLLIQRVWCEFSKKQVGYGNISKEGTLIGLLLTSWVIGTVSKNGWHILWVGWFLISGWHLIRSCFSLPGCSLQLAVFSLVVLIV